MTEEEAVSETLDINSVVTHLIVWEKLIAELKIIKMIQSAANNCFKFKYRTS
jgi:hypothetical protein